MRCGPVEAVSATLDSSMREQLTCMSTTAAMVAANAKAARASASDERLGASSGLVERGEVISYHGVR